MNLITNRDQTANAGRAVHARASADMGGFTVNGVYLPAGPDGLLW